MGTILMAGETDGPIDVLATQWQKRLACLRARFQGGQIVPKSIDDLFDDFRRTVSEGRHGWWQEAQP